MAESNCVCQFCKHWKPVESDGGIPAAKAECRRFPPVPALLDGDIRAVYPPATADMGCGEWEQQSIEEQAKRSSGRVMVYPNKRRSK